MQPRRSASCLALTAVVSADEKCASGMVLTSRCGLMNSAARGTAIWVRASIVVLFGRTSRPGLPCFRAAVSAYLFQMSAIFDCLCGCVCPALGPPMTGPSTSLGPSIRVFHLLIQNADGRVKPGHEE